MMFDFNTKNKQGFSGIYFGKGVFFSTGFLFCGIVCLFVVIMSPWELNFAKMAPKVFFLLFFSCFFAQYHRSIIKLSIDKDRLSVKTWKRDRDPCPEAD